MWDNSLAVLAPSLFSTASNLLLLSLYGNQLRGLPPSVFQATSSLITLFGLLRSVFILTDSETWIRIRLRHCPGICSYSARRSRRSTCIQTKSPSLRETYSRRIRGCPTSCSTLTGSPRYQIACSVQTHRSIYCTDFTELFPF